MLVQYLVGLCCLRHDPDAVDVTLGELVYDEGAGDTRDVDVTVTIKENNNTVSAFKAYEVKKEGRPLDVIVTEQLCAKLLDMPSVTHRGIVSSSGFTKEAVNKAKSKDVELFQLKPWTEPLKEHFKWFKGPQSANQFLRDFTSNLLYWIDYHYDVVVPDGHKSFLWDSSTSLFTVEGKKHKEFPNMDVYVKNLYSRSTGILWRLEPATTIARTFPAAINTGNTDDLVTPPWPHSHTLQVHEDAVFLRLDEGLTPIVSVTISGSLQWKRRQCPSEFFLLQKFPDGDPFAGAVVTALPEEKMLAMVFSPTSRETGVHQFELLEKHKNAIRSLKIRSESKN